jgi:hypothetical protein
MAEPNSAENLPALRATLARYYEHWGESPEAAAQLAREMLRN